MAIRSPSHLPRRHDAPEEPVVARFRERVVAAFDDHVERIVLFGSRARGDDHAESDWDFAVLFDRAPTEREEQALSELTWAVRDELDAEIQAIARPGPTYETIVYNSYYAMFHAARAALLAVEGSASTNHGRVVTTFAQMLKHRRLQGGREHAAALEAAFKLRVKADYSSEDLTDEGRRLRDQFGSFLGFCRELVESAASGG